MVLSAICMSSIEWGKRQEKSTIIDEVSLRTWCSRWIKNVFKPAAVAIVGALCIECVKVSEVHRVNMAFNNSRQRKSFKLLDDSWIAVRNYLDFICKSLHHKVWIIIQSYAERYHIIAPLLIKPAIDRISTSRLIERNDDVRCRKIRTCQVNIDICHRTTVLRSTAHRII